MQFERDNELDVLLRRIGRSGETLPAANVAEHLDPDEFLAFAEDALPQTARSRYAAHLADCTVCRETLNQFVAINTEVERLEEVKTTADAATAQTAQASWATRFKQWLAVPNFGYAAAACGLLIVGAISLTTWRNVQEQQQSTTAEMVQTDYEPQRDEQTAAEAEQRQAAEPSPASETPTENNGTDAATADQTGDATIQPEVEQPRSTAAPTLSAPTSPRANTARSSSNRANSRSSASNSASNTAEREEIERREAANRFLARQRTRQVAGKTFRRQGAGFVDVAYKAGRVTTVRRGTNDYKNLPAGVRSIAEQLNGEVTVVYEGRAYRIR